MMKSEIVRLSPLRILDNSTHGGVGPGNIGVLAARHGVGKTSALVHMATDKLLQGLPVIHVTFASSTAHILDYYDEIFAEIVRLKDLADANTLQAELNSQRTVMGFDRDAIASGHLLDSLRRRIHDGGLRAKLVVFDDANFHKMSRADLKKIRDFGAEEELEIWFSVSLEDEGATHAERIPRVIDPFLDLVDVVLNLTHQPIDGRVHLELVKDHHEYPETTSLILDPRTLLIANSN